MTGPQWTDWLHTVLILLLTGLCQTSSNTSPSLQTKAQNLRLPKGETAKLHCKVVSGGSLPLVWRRGYSVLATGPVLVSPDPRLRIEEHGGKSTLVISSLTEKDAGEYVCQLSLMDGILSVQHTLDILVNPSISPVPTSGHTAVKEGEEAILQCQVGGNPVPTVSWSREGGGLPGQAHPACPRGGCLNIPNVSRADAGHYVCTASNGVGEPATATLGLTVRFPPTVRVEKELVATGPGQRLELVCNVEGEPLPTMVWYFGENKVHTSVQGGISVHHTSNLHTLTISETDSSTFGNYSCLASNSLGSYKKHIEVHGRPTEATFLRGGMRSGRNSFELSWKVHSFVKIHEYRLLYRGLTTTGTKTAVANSDWTNVIIPGSERFTGGEQITRWRLDNLAEDSQYECLVQARNDYGWSQPSQMFTFSTSQKTFQSPATSGLNWGGPQTGRATERVVWDWTLGVGLMGMLAGRYW